ncbi:MAG: diaminopimelate epimerase [Clostridia bacterium]|nr:diaminopimelate epimerase [Clostridia bacterium]
MEFYKYHGAGNDFILMKSIGDYTMSEVAKTLCHRRFGVGADGFMVPEASEIADIKMVYYNSDGSYATMCGNGIRCFSKFVYEEAYVDQTSFSVETGDGIKDVVLTLEGDEVVSVTVKMSDGGHVIDRHHFDMAEVQYEGMYLHLGVPHLVVPVEHISEKEITTYGPLMEKASVFPKGTNVNFARVVSRDQIHVDTWERGAGYTYACGTGCCATVYSLHQAGMLEGKVRVFVKGGELVIEVLPDQSVMMTGPAIKICKGVFLSTISDGNVL